jgi:predicted nicotinamide N-methyase
MHMPAAATEIAGSGLTVTSTVLLAVHPFTPTPVSEYTVVDAGSATGLVQVVQERAVAGAQV